MQTNCKGCGIPLSSETQRNCPVCGTENQNYRNDNQENNVYSGSIISEFGQTLVTIVLVGLIAMIYIGGIIPILLYNPISTHYFLIKKHKIPSLTRKGEELAYKCSYVFTAWLLIIFILSKTTRMFVPQPSNAFYFIDYVVIIGVFLPFLIYPFSYYSKRKRYFDTVLSVIKYLGCIVLGLISCAMVMGFADNSSNSMHSSNYGNSNNSQKGSIIQKSSSTSTDISTAPPVDSTQPKKWNYEEIKAGNYNSLEQGHWSGVAYEKSSDNGTEVEWNSGERATMSVNEDTMDIDSIYIRKGVMTWSDGKNTQTKFEFEEKGNALIGNSADYASRPINLSFYPKGTGTVYTPSNGVTFDTTKPTIVFQYYLTNDLSFTMFYQPKE